MLDEAPSAFTETRDLIPMDEQVFPLVMQMTGQRDVRLDEYTARSR